MYADLYWLDGDTVRELLKERDWNQASLWKTSTLSRTRVAQIVHNAKPVSFETVRVLAKKLKVPINRLRPRLADSLRWQSVPELEGKVLREARRKMQAAAEADMQGNHDEAVKIAETVREDVLDRDEDVEAYDAVFVRLLTFMDHAAEQQRRGSHRDIALLIRDFVNACGGVQSTSWPWIQYQYAICLCKMKDWYSARGVLDELSRTDNRGLQIAVSHQLAVVEIEEAKSTRGRAKRIQLLGAARARLQSCMNEWEKTGGHRAGFSQRRLGELEALCANRAESLKYYLRALMTFCRYHCDRYAEDTRCEIERLCRF